jgi:hypothetical protein
MEPVDGRDPFVAPPHSLLLGVLDSSSTVAPRFST